ncbi:hypothetical protein [Dethiothermospora halolimnae]|uniref:hypothetical protein n=1 Tax=Dethiothermospora halolimnae TaxID=3114390 RepID=UPI003CCC23E1
MKRFLVLMLILLITFSLVACGDDSEDNDQPSQDNIDNLDKDGDISNDTDNGENNEDNVNTKVKYQYVGLIDNNSAEILVNGEAKSFRLSEPLKNLLPYIEPESNQQVSIDYEDTDNKQLLLNTLTWESKNIVGEYVGQIDSNFIEVKINDTSLSFKLGEELDKSKLDSLKRGMKIKLDYYVNTDSQTVITNINKAE